MREALSSALVRDLRGIVGRDAVITARDRLLTYESDGLTAYRAAPQAVVLPADTGQARAVLAALHEAAVPVVPRGAGTGLSGGAVAMSGGVVVGMARMNRVLEVDPANRRARAQAGTINAHLSRAARPHGLYYAPDPSSQSACTLGGNVGENSGGPHCLKYGVTTRYVAGLTLVLPDGEVVELDRRAGEGLDLGGVVVGSEGCLGLVTEIEVELLPLPEAVRTLLAVFDSLEDAGRAVTDIIGGGLLPAALEIVDRETIRAVESSVYAAGYPVDAAAALVVEFDGLEAGLDDDVGRAEACCREAGAREVRCARDEAERTALWKGRKKAFGAMGRVAPDLMVQDATVPRTRLPDVLERIGEIGRRYELTVANVFHAGDGNLHPNILFDRRNGDELARVEQASREMMQVCVDAGGTITGEHGVGTDKRGYMRLVHGPAELAAMADVKAVFNPAGRFNPGKVLPDGVRPTAEGEATAAGRGERGGGPSGSPEALVSGLEGLLGHEAVRWDEPLAAPVATPSDTEQVAAVLNAANASGWTVWPRGAGLEERANGARALAQSPAEGRPLVVLSTLGLADIPMYEPADLTLSAGAGVSLAALAERTDPAGQWLPLDPPGTDGASLGGVLATGLGGPLAATFGAPRGLVLGLTCVTGAGRVLRLGGRVVKNVAGFDLVRLVVGSRGRLAVVTEATLRLFPRPGADRVLVARAARAKDLVADARTVAAGGLTPRAHGSPRARGADVAATAPALPAAVELGQGVEEGGGATLAVRLQGSEASVAEQERRLRGRLPALEPLGPAAAQALLGSFRTVGCRGRVGVRCRFAPAALASVVADAPELEAEAGGPSPWAVDCVRGVLRREGPPAASGDPDTRVRPVAEEGRPAGGGARRLARGLMARFDPGGVLGPVPRSCR